MAERRTNKEILYLSFKENKQYKHFLKKAEILIGVQYHQNLISLKILICIVAYLMSGFLLKKNDEATTVNIPGTC